MKEPTLKKVAYGIVMAVAIVIVHFIDARVYTLSPWLALVLVIVLIYSGITLVKKSGKLEQTISRSKYNAINVLVVLVLFLAYYTISQ